MFGTLKKLYGILTPDERRKSIWVFLVMLLVAIFEVAGVASIMPFISVLSNPQSVTDNAALQWAYQWSGFDSRNQFVVALGVVFLTVVFSSLTLKAISQWMQIRFTKMRVHFLGRRLMQGYLNQPYEWFLSQHTSKMTTTVLSEVNNVISKSLFPAIQLIAQSTVVLFLLVALLVIDPFLALMAGLGLGVAYTVLYLLVRGPLLRFGRRRYNANMKRYRVTQETFGGIKDVKVGCLENNMVQRFIRPSYQTANEEVKAAIVKQVPGHLMQAILFAGVVAILLYLKQVHGSMAGALPTFSAFAFAGYRLMPALQQIYRHVTSLRSNEAALDGLLDTIESLNPIGVEKTSDEGGRFERVSQGIELQEVRYRYPSAGDEALKGITLDIPARQRIGLVGASGSGKTTTVDIILGLLRPSHGRMIVDGTEIEDSNIRQWQRSIGYVPQHIFLADETIAANIAFGVKQSDIDMNSVERAARIANLHDFIITELTDGYQTEVGERGVRLSGGQRQRIGIARALYHDPDVIIMDEATSALDNQTEKSVMTAVDNLADTKTIILIAHRLTTVEKCDRIYMLDHGNVVAQGSYEDLIERNPEFRAMAGT